MSVSQIIYTLLPRNLTIWWTNPTTSVDCYEATRLEVDLSYHSTDLLLDASTETYWQPLCENGAGQFRLSTLGGDGYSDEELKSFLYPFEGT